MKKSTVISKVILMALIITCFTFASVSAAGLEGTEVTLVDEEFGYKIIVPGFIGDKNVNFEGSEFHVIVMETPEKSADGTYPIFEIITTDKDAKYVGSFPGALGDGQLGDFMGEFNQGRLMYSPSFAIGGDLKDLSDDLIFAFDFMVDDKDHTPLTSVVDLYFMFVDKAATPAPAAPAPMTETKAADVVTANPTNSKVMVNGKNIAFEAYEIGGSNYFKLRDLAMALNGSGKQFQVGWDGANNAINLITNTAYTPVGKELTVTPNATAKEAKLTQSKIFINGKEVQLTAYSIGGNNYFKLRDLGKAFDFAVTWDGKLNMIGIDASKGYTE